MGVTNRAKDASEQKSEVAFAMNSQVSTGASLISAPLPYPGILQSVRGFAVGMSGSPQLNFYIKRFAAGNTAIPISISAMVLATYGTSGILGYSGLAANGSTLLILQAGDALSFDMSVANTAATGVFVNFVVKKTQDIVQYFGNSG